ncbi:MAG TPA: carboxypeptidase regulatory-like domain-containing protein [Streptosporangiaceae bacterium]
MKLPATASLATVLLVAGVLAAPAQAQAAHAAPVATRVGLQGVPVPAADKRAKPVHSCPAPSGLNRVQCSAEYLPGVGPQHDAGGNSTGTEGTAPLGYSPADLQSAYQLPSAAGGNGATVAVVEADDDPSIESDLAVYRSEYGLPPCTTASGCFRKVDENGGTNYPAPDPGFAQEIALDAEMVSAGCPNCHILLVEASSPTFTDLGTAVDTAVSLGAKYVVNTYGGSGEASEELQLDSYYNHPGVAMVAAAGAPIVGSNVNYPASSPYVTAVGGTTLTHSHSARGWAESAWAGTASGCSQFEPKPVFQTDTGCANRTVADVSAVADPDTGVAVYDSYEFSGWSVFGGTGVAASLVTAAYALAGPPAPGSYPNSYPYLQHTGLNDVTRGITGTGGCSPAYLCTAGKGFDGPTGLGTPAGVAAFTPGSYGTVRGTVVDAGTGQPLAGVRVTLGTVASAVTGTDGTYSLAAPVGTYPLSATDYGYATPHPVTVTVASAGAKVHNFSMAATQDVTVSGKITGDSGHGWPLYAQIAVAGVPGAPVYTNPFTGAYSIQLPAQATYQLQVTPVEGNYGTAKVAVPVGTGNKTEPIAVPVDAMACAAPGYRSTDQAPAQPFNSAGTPAGWTEATTSGNLTWSFSDPGHVGNRTGGAGGFAIADSAAAPDGQDDEAELVSPRYDLSSAATPTISFDTAATYNYGGEGSNEESVELSTDGGHTWALVWSENYQSIPATHVEIPIPQAAGHSNVRVTFGYSNLGASWWELDNVAVGQRTCSPVAGAAVAGQVTSSLTHAPLDGATVSAGADSAVTGNNPADPALPDGFYWLFAPGAGQPTLHAKAARYATATKTADVAATRITRTNFALGAGRLAAPQPLSDTLTSGTSATQAVTLHNTGSAPAHVRLSVDDSAPKGKPAWRQLAQLPVTNLPGEMAADPSTGKLYVATGQPGDSYVYDPLSNAWSPFTSPPDQFVEAASAFVDGELAVVGGAPTFGGSDPVTTVRLYNPATGTWTTGAGMPQAVMQPGVAVLGDDLYVIGGCTGLNACADGSISTVQRYDAAANTWTTVASYPLPAFDPACGALDGELYCTAGGWSSVSSSANAQTYVYDPAANVWSELRANPAPHLQSSAAVADGKLIVTGGYTYSSSSGEVSAGSVYAYSPGTGTWTELPQLPRAVEGLGSSCGLYALGWGLDAAGGLSPGLQKLSGYDQCATGPSWLTAAAPSLTVPAHGSATAKITLSATGLAAQPGTYTGQLTVATGTPFAAAPVDVTLTVQPPASWGQLSGTVSGQGCTGDPAPLAGASVQVDTPAQNYSLVTDASGNYSLWLPGGLGPITALYGDSGWRPATKTVTVMAGLTTTQNVTLVTTSHC